jgi:Flp pilus assembly protein TadG
MRKIALSARKREKGQSFVELGLSMVFLIVLLSAVIDLGWAFFTMIALRDAAQEAATVGSICPTDFAKVRARAKASASAPLDMSKFQDSQINVCIVTPGSSTCGASVALGNSVQVTINYDHKIVTPFVGGFIGTQTYPLTARASDTIMRLNCDAIP